MLKALVVEDNRLVQEWLCGLLQTEYPDMQIVAVPDGAGLIEKIEAIRPDVVFVDIRLPGANGIELTRKILQSHSELPVVIMTWHDESEYREAAYAAGATQFVRKDEIDADLLASIMASLGPRPSRIMRKQRTGWLASLTDRVAARRVAAVLAAGLLMLPVSFVFHEGPLDTTGHTYHTLATAGIMERFTANDVRVMFADEVPAIQLTALLQSVHGRIVDGPSERGVYTVRMGDDVKPSEQDMADTLARLRANEAVLLAEPSLVPEATAPLR